jgi:hypothetical protein
MIIPLARRAGVSHIGVRMLVEGRDAESFFRGRTRRMVRAVFSVFNTKPSYRPLAGFGVLNASDLRLVSFSAVASQLAHTQICCKDLNENFPSLARPYRQRRRTLVCSALTIAADRILLTSRKLASEDGSAPAMSLTRQGVALAKASLLRCLYRSYGLLLEVVPTERLWRLDDAAIRLAKFLITCGAGIVEQIDNVGTLSSRHRPSWQRLEVVGGNGVNYQVPDFSPVDDALWHCPTRLSKLITLSTWRDNNTGKYYHPQLSQRFGDTVVTGVLEETHRALCHELLACRLPDIVDELEIYADQTCGDRQQFLRSWRRVRAYRVTQPANLDVFTSSFFEFTFEFAVEAMALRAPDVTTAFRQSGT